MSRRRMMMLQAKEDSGIELLDEYKLELRFYNMTSSWGDNTVRLSHFNQGFSGPTQGYLLLIGKSNKYGQNINGAFNVEAWNSLEGFENNKRYKLTLVVKTVNQNTATESTTDTLSVSIGRRGAYYTSSVNIKDISVGTKIEVEMTSASFFEGVVFGSTVGNALWDFDFSYKIEEVE